MLTLKTLKNSDFAVLVVAHDLYKTLTPTPEITATIQQIEIELTARIDGIESMDSLIDLVDDLESKGVIDFGYPQKIITPSPTGFGRWWNQIFKK